MPGKVNAEALSSDPLISNCISGKLVVVSFDQLENQEEKDYHVLGVTDIVWHHTSMGVEAPFIAIILPLPVVWS